MPHDSNWHFGFDKPGWLRDALNGLNWDYGGWWVWDLWLFDWHIATIHVPPFGFYPGAWIENAADVIGWTAADWGNFVLDRIRDIHGFADAAYTWIVDIWNQLGNVWTWLNNAVGWAWNIIAQWWTGTFNNVVNLINSIVDNARAAIQSFFQPVTDWFNGVRLVVDDFLRDPWSFLYAKVVQPILDALYGWVLLFTAARSWYDSSAAMLHEFTNNPIDFIGERLEAWVDARIDRVVNFVIRMLERVW